MGLALNQVLASGDNNASFMYIIQFKEHLFGQILPILGMGRLNILFISIQTEHTVIFKVGAIMKDLSLGVKRFYLPSGAGWRFCRPCIGGHFTRRPSYLPRRSAGLCPTSRLSPWGGLVRSSYAGRGLPTKGSVRSRGRVPVCLKWAGRANSSCPCEARSLC